MSLIKKDDLVNGFRSALDQDVSGTRDKVHLQCFCGSLFSARMSNILYGTTKSCGCARKKHGNATRINSHEYYSWQSMKQRCTNPNADGFHRYGGRGISVCDEWLHSFETFLKDMGSRPDGTSIERINSDDGYYPENCRWATSKEQSRNRCDNRIITAFGESVTLTEAAIKYDISKGCLTARLKKMSVEDALTMPLKSRRPRKN